jgi:excisionase family DNA binding protein
VTDAPTPWMTAEDAGAYLKRGKRFVLAEIKAGRLRAARIGGRGEILTRREWCDSWVEAQATPVLFSPPRSPVVQTSAQRKSP